MFELLKHQTFRNLLVLAVLLKIILLPFYFHPDIKTYHFQSSFLKEGVWNIYSYLSSNKNTLPLKEEFVYFPLTYFTLGTYQIVASPLLGSEFNHWLFNASVTSIEDPNVFRYLFILKLPYLLLDILIAFMLTYMVSDLQKKKTIFTFWLFNPFSLVLIYLYSNVDIFPVFLIVLSLYFASKNNLFASSLALGIGAGFKAFPLLLVPFLLLKASTIKEKFLVITTSFSAFLLSVLPFITSGAFRESTLVSGLTTRIMSYGIDIGFGEILMPGLILLSIVFFWGIWNKGVDLWRYYLVALLLVLSSIHFHIHWLLWIIPFFSLLIIKGDSSEIFISFVLLIVAFTIPLLYSDKFMSVGLLSVISPLFGLLPTPAAVIQKIYNPLSVQGALHSLLFAGSLVLSWKILGGKR